MNKKKPWLAFTGYRETPLVRLKIGQKGRAPDPREIAQAINLHGVSTLTLMAVDPEWRHKVEAYHKDAKWQASSGEGDRAQWGLVARHIGTVLALTMKQHGMHMQQSAGVH